MSPFSFYRAAVLAMIRKMGSHMKVPGERGGEFFALPPRASEIVDDSGAERENSSECCNCDGNSTARGALSRWLEDEDIAVIEAFGDIDRLCSCAREMHADRLEDQILRLADNTHGDQVPTVTETGKIQWVFNAENVRRASGRIEARKALVDSLRAAQRRHWH